MLLRDLKGERTWAAIGAFARAPTPGPRSADCAN
jgi:hypothetical protein